MHPRCHFQASFTANWDFQRVASQVMTVHPPPPPGLLKGEEPGECLRVCLLINLSKDANGSLRHGRAASFPSSACLAEFGEAALWPQGAPRWLWVGEGVCLHPGCSSAGCGWLGSWLRGAELYLFGGVVVPQPFRRGAFSPGRELQEVDEHGGRGTCSPGAHWLVPVAVLEYWPIQAAILNIHTICSKRALTWRTFFFFQFRDDEKQRQRWHSWIKNKRTVDSTDQIHFQRSRDENEAVSLFALVAFGVEKKM